MNYTAFDIRLLDHSMIVNSCQTTVLCWAYSAVQYIPTEALTYSSFIHGSSMVIDLQMYHLRNYSSKTLNTQESESTTCTRLCCVCACACMCLWVRALQVACVCVRVLRLLLLLLLLLSCSSCCLDDCWCWLLRYWTQCCCSGFCRASKPSTPSWPYPCLPLPLPAIYISPALTHHLHRPGIYQKGSCGSAAYAAIASPDLSPD